MNKLRLALSKIIACPVVPQSIRDMICHKILDVKSCGFRERIYIKDLDNIHIGAHCYIGRGGVS